MRDHALTFLRDLVFSKTQTSFIMDPILLLKFWVKGRWCPITELTRSTNIKEKSAKRVWLDEFMKFYLIKLNVPEFTAKFKMKYLTWTYLKRLIVIRNIWKKCLNVSRKITDADVGVGRGGGIYLNYLSIIEFCISIGVVERELHNMVPKYSIVRGISRTWHNCSWLPIIFDVSKFGLPHALQWYTTFKRS
jgi:hypothetical protein